MENEQLDHKLLSILHLYRHDWLNDLQIIFGYMKLKKYDQLERFLDTIKTKLEQDSAIARLDIPRLTLNLLEFNHQNEAYKLTVQIEQGLDHFKQAGVSDVLNELVMTLLRSFQLYARITDQINQLQMMLSKEENDFFVTFKYEGHADAEQLQQAIADKMKQFSKRVQILWSADIKDTAAFVRLSLPAQHMK